MSVAALPILTWSTLDAAAQRAALRRPVRADADTHAVRIGEILAQVRRNGDAALRRLTEQYDKVALDELAAQPAEFAAAEAALSREDVQALERAIANVTTFHEAQRPGTLRVETSPGVVCERIVRPIDAVGLYVPAGTAPLPSTAIMLAVPAAIAGCATRVICTPPRPDGTADAAVLAVARLCGIDQVFKVGGAQAIAALAYGTESVPRVDKIFGPGNAWVTAAKLIVANDPDGAALDLPAGPSEVLVIADDQADPEFVAADLLAQAEHSVDAQSVLVTPSAALANAVLPALERQRAQLTRASFLAQAIEHARIIVVPDLATAFDVSNAYAPEHLILQIREPRRWLDRVRAAGSVFLGPWTPETMGDYCSGTNHVLPTCGFARAYSGLGLQDFMRRITVQELSSSGIEDLGPTAVRIARLEGLDAHARAVTIRLDALRSRSRS